MNVKNNKMRRSGHFSVAIKEESFFSIKWNLTTFKLLMNQFHSSKKISYSGYCRVRCDGSLIALGGRRCLYRGEIDHVLSGKKPANDPVLRKKWTLMNGICMKLGTETSRNLSTNLNGTRDSFIEIMYFFASERILYILIFSQTLPSVWRYVKSSSRKECSGEESDLYFECVHAGRALTGQLIVKEGKHVN